VYKALKKLKLEEETQGFPITATREINILKMLDHKNIVKLENIIIDEPFQPQESSRKA
jgi:serine/threonine protein kinase